MQDLVINRSLTWRSVPNVKATPSGGSVVPANPNRVALILWDTVNNSIATAFVDQLTTAAPLLSYLDLGVANVVVPGCIRMTDFPGAFGGPLYTTVDKNNLSAMECVYDTALAEAVSAGYSRLLAAQD